MGKLYDVSGNVVPLDMPEPYINDIPIVGIYVDGNPPTTKEDGAVPATMFYKSKTKSFTNYITMAIQGSSSQWYPKKNYTVKLFKDSGLTKKDKHEFRDWKSANKFVLKANWIDHSHARNIVNARLWDQIVRSRSDFNSLPKQLRNARLAVDGFPVKVYLNGVYQGLYTWNLPKSVLYDLDDAIPENTLLECDSSHTEDKLSSLFRADNDEGGNWGDETHDEKPAIITTAWNNVLAFVNSSTDANFTANFQNYFDKQSVIDEQIFIHLACIVDNLGKNQFYFTYDATKWYGGMYDMDGTWGCPPFPPSRSTWYEYNTVFQSGYTICNNGGQTNKLHERVTNLFASDIQTRYEALRATVLSEDNILAEFDKFMSVIPPYLYAEDYAETTAGGAYINIPLKDTNNILQIREFVNARCAYVDSVILI